MCFDMFDYLESVKNILVISNYEGGSRLALTMLTRDLGPKFDSSKCVIKVIKQLTFCSGFISANFEGGGGSKTCADQGRPL